MNIVMIVFIKMHTKYYQARKYGRHQCQPHSYGQTTAAPIGVLGKEQIPGIKNVVRITGNYFYALYQIQGQSI